MVFASEKTRRVHFEISRLAELGFDVLIIGETGVGKDMVAFELHARSSRRNRPFIQIPMRTLSDSLIESELFGHERGAFSGAEKMRIGKLEAADGGTIYLPEISTLSEPVQLKLLQFLQYKSIAKVGQDARTPEKQLDVWVIMATNESLPKLVQEGKMRRDFYHRITGVMLTVPPLRERMEEIEPLASFFLKKFSNDSTEPKRITPEALELLRRHSWPGNVRELENCIKSALARTSDGQIGANDVQLAIEPDHPASSCSSCIEIGRISLEQYAAAVQNFKAAYCTEVLRRVNNDITAAARLAGMTPQGFRKLLKSLQIHVKENAPPLFASAAVLSL